VPGEVNWLDAGHCVVVLVDYQQRLMPSIDHGSIVLEHAQFLVDVALALGLPVIGTEQNPQGLGSTVDAIQKRLSTTLPKMHFDACVDGLLELLRPSSAASSPTGVVIAGCESHVCLLQTALGLLGAGHPVWVIASACGSRAADDHALAIERLRQAGAEIATVEMVAFEWLRSCQHERFKPVLEIIKARPKPREASM
jgi:nicotinamidase-related amidase